MKHKRKWAKKKLHSKEGWTPYRGHMKQQTESVTLETREELGLQQNYMFEKGECGQRRLQGKLE